MADNSKAKKIDALPSGASFDANDRIIVLDSSANLTVQITKTLLQTSMFSGPYANDAVANTSGVVVGQPYYNANGAVFVRRA